MTTISQQFHQEQYNMTTQPTALKLADWISHRTNIMLQDREAAAELRRQHEQIKTLVAAHSANVETIDCQQAELEQHKKRIVELEAQLAEAMKSPQYDTSEEEMLHEENCRLRSHIKLLQSRLAEIEAQLGEAAQAAQGISAEWLKANGPGGWIQQLRNEVSALNARIEVDFKRWQEAIAKYDFERSLNEKLMDGSAKLTAKNQELQSRLAEIEKAEPVAWMEMVTVNLVRKGVNKHEARELAQHFYTAHPVAAPTGNIVMDSYNQMVAMKAAPVLTDEQIDAAHIAADKSFRKHKMQIRGQQIMPSDGWEWHFARSIEAAVRGNHAPS
jgi:DNA repair exonuclease SbcCD ATPase subunit